MKTPSKVIFRSGICLAFLIYSSWAISSVITIERWHTAGSTPQVQIDWNSIEFPNLTAYLETELSHGGKAYRIFDGLEGYELVELNPLEPLGVGDGTQFLHINGMLNDRDRLLEVLEYITISYQNLSPGIHVGAALYNRSGSQGMQDLQQELKEDGAYLCAAINNDQEFYISNETIIARCHGIVELQSDSDYGDVLWQKFPEYYAEKHYDQYLDQDHVEKFATLILNTVKAGQKVIVFAHSQGNFYTRDALKHISNDSTERRFLSSIGVIQVGSPVHPSDFPEGVMVSFIANCSDPIGMLSGAYPLIAEELDLYVGCTKKEDRWVENDLPNHDIIKHYMADSNDLKIREAMLSMHKELIPPHQVFEVGDLVVTNDELNVRSDSIISDSTLKYVVDSGSKAEIVDIVGTANNYFWYKLCFDSNAQSNPHGLPGGCGLAASKWLQLDEAGGDEPVVVEYPTFKRNYETLAQAPSGELTVLGGLNLSPPDQDDQVLGRGGCINCSSTAPYSFSIANVTTSCNQGMPLTAVYWEGATGAQSYSVYRDSELLNEHELSTSFADSGNIELGSTYEYFVKAHFQDGSRNSTNGWRVTIPYDICGDPVPEPPYDGPQPAIITGEVAEMEINTARLTATVDFNGVCSSNLHFEFGPTEVLGTHTSAYVLGCPEGDVTFTWDVPTECDSEVFYEAIANHNNGEVRGGVRSFATPNCTTATPTNVMLEHDVVNNDLVFTFEESIAPKETFLELWQYIVEDPRADADENVWKKLHTYPANQGSIRNVYTDPQPGAIYIYKIRTFNSAAGEQGYGEFTEEIPIAIEGEFIQEIVFPRNIDVRILLSGELFITGDPGVGEFVIERSVNDGEYSSVGTLVSEGGFDWHDSDVISGNEYCYRFEQEGNVSERYCNTFYSEGDLGVPTLLSIERLSDNSVKLRHTSNAPHEGWFITWHRYHMEEYRNFGNSVLLADDDIVEDVAYGSSDYPACYKVSQHFNGAANTTGFSNELCLPVGDSYIEYQLPVSPKTPAHLKVNGLSDPDGIKASPIYFNAWVEDDDEGDRIDSCHVQVSEVENDWSTPLWDSGRQDLFAAIFSHSWTGNIPYAGPMPAPEQEVYWRVRCYDSHDLVSAWSTEQASFSIEPYDSSLVAYYSFNGRIGDARKQENAVNPLVNPLEERGPVRHTDTGYDQGVFGAYQLENGAYLGLGEVYTPSANPVSISFELSGGNGGVVYAYEPSTENYISIAAVNNNLVISLGDSEGHILSYTDGSGGEWRFKRVDVNIFNDEVAQIELYVDGRRYARWPVFSDHAYLFSRPLTWVVGRKVDSEGGAYDRMTGFVDELKIYDRVRSAEEISDDYDYSRTLPENPPDPMPPGC